MSRMRKLQLPDDIHFVEIIDYDRFVLCSVLHGKSLDRKEEFRVMKSMSQWNDLVHQFCELARRKYPAQLRHKSISIHRQRIGL